MVNKTETLVACIDELAPRYLIGSDPFDVERLAWNMRRAEYGRPGEVAQSPLAAFDVACWDLMGQSLGVPVWKLLGGNFRDRVPAYANGWYQAERDAAAIAARRAGSGRARLPRAQAGSVRCGAAPNCRRPNGAASRRSSRRSATRSAPDVQIFVEMHGRFTPATAVRVAAMLEPYDPEWIEEPVPPENAEALRSRSSGHPYSDRHRRTRAHDRPKSGDSSNRRRRHRSGRSDAFRRVPADEMLAGWADAHHLLLAPHNVCGPVGTMANVHLGGRHTELQSAGALQRFRRCLGPRAGGRGAARGSAADGCFAAARAARASASR